MDDDEFFIKKIVQRKRRERLYFMIICVVAAIIAYLIGFFAHTYEPSQCDDVSKSKVISADEKEKVYDEMVDMLKAENIEANLKYFTAHPHAAATPRNNELLDEIYRRFESYKFVAKYHRYDVLLSFPDPDQRNYIYVVDKDGNKEFQSLGIEYVLEPVENDTTAYSPFNSYGPNGTVEGELVYANYGTVEDFKELQNTYNVNVSGKIVITRYGKIYRGNKVANAQNLGAIGVIIYSDPFDSAPEGEKFIKGRWLPDDGVQRGSVIGLVEDGDILSMGYAGKPWAYHEDVSNVEHLMPQIPVQPVSAYDAYNLMKHMGGIVVSESWTGKLNLTEYRVGPYTDTSRKVRMEVFNKREVKTITNVCGTIKGSIEPDRFVLFGNHVDAWVYGGVDPFSGTSVMMEIARVMGEKVKTGWQPRRTIKFCGWDAEEHNLIGSSEYVKEFESQLRDRAVAYINLDSAVSGNESLVCGASPLLHELMFKVHKKVMHPYSSKTVFEQSNIALPDDVYPGYHKIGSLGSGSDFFGFYQFVGVPSVDFTYSQLITNKRLGTSSYPVYHSLHDTFYWVKHFADREFKFHQAVAKIGMYYMLYIADSEVIPFDVKRYAELLQRETAALTKKLSADEFKSKGLTTEYLKSASDNFTSAYDEFMTQKETVDLTNALNLRIFNDRLSQLEKGFLYPDGLPGRTSIKHYIMAPYSSSFFPAIGDMLFEAKKTNNWNEVKKQISITALIIQSVAENLRSLI